MFVGWWGRGYRDRRSVRHGRRYLVGRQPGFGGDGE